MSTTLREDGDYGVSPTASKADFLFAPHPSSVTSASQITQRAEASDSGVSFYLQNSVLRFSAMFLLWITS